MRNVKPLAFSLAVLATAACTNHEPLGKGFGDSVRHNMSMHIINPTPSYRNAGAPDMSGARAANAIGRYQRGEEKDLKIEDTSDQ